MAGRPTIAKREPRPGLEPGRGNSRRPSRITRIAATPCRRHPAANHISEKAIEQAQRIAQELSAIVDTRHLLAAYLVLPHYHDDDFQQLGVERIAWAEGFSRAMMPRYPKEESFWIGFPSAVMQSQRGAPQPESAPRLVAEAPADPRDFDWFVMEPHVREAMETAFALAGSDMVRPSHVLRAVLMGTASDMPFSSSASFQRFSQIVRLPDPGARPSGPKSSLVARRLDGALRRHLEFAQQPLHKEGASTTVWGRDMVTAVLLCGPDAAALIEEAGATIEDVRDQWYAYVVSDASHRTRDDWDAWWRYAGIPLPGPVRAGFATETDVGDDKLGIAGEARAIARLILDRQVEAPLSIGLLGDWGCGKSFFIEQVKKQIAELKREARPELYQNPIEIEFNAWHASDSNLWASLVTHIFDEIWEKVSPTGNEEPEAARRRLLKQIEEARGAVHEAEAQVEYGRIALERAEQDLARKQADLAWDRVVKDEAQDRLKALSEAAGWHEPLATINAVEAAVHTLAGSSNRLRRALVALLERPFRRIAVPTIALAVVAVILWLVLGTQPGLAAQLARWLGSIASAIGALIAPLALANRKVAVLANQLGRIRDKYDAKVKDLPEAERKRLTTAHRELDSAEKSVEAAKARLADLLSQQAALDPRRRLGAFLQERVQSTVYRSQQGIISPVYQDFEQLSRYMKELRAEQAKNKALDDGNIRAFDRIVIYVDDLDRCRPAHVVAMLEAVHLLLALDLFIVIVAVDSRWLTRALEVHYKDLLDTADAADGMSASTPQSYLEKIFQITYALRPMDPEYFRSYVEFLADAPAEAIPPAPPVPAEDVPVSAAPRPAPAGAPSTAPTDGTALGSGPSLPTLEPLAPPAPPVRTVRRGRPVIINAQEQELISRLLPLVPTPRIAKRLVNVYRVIKAGTELDEQGQFEHDRCVPCLLMLAILFGRPLIAEELLRSLHEGTAPFDEPGAQLIDAVARRAVAKPETAAEWKRLHAALQQVRVTATVERCAREPAEIARYSLVTGHNWHTWTERPAALSPGPARR
ncbi:MAG TPA: P-loop NTPase fold protein, partial [Kofleriaceae bacterium]